MTHNVDSDRLSPTEVGSNILVLGNHLKEWEVYCKRDLGGIARKVKELDFSLQDCNPAQVEKKSRARLDKLKIPRSAGARPKDVLVTRRNVPVISKVIGQLYWRVGLKLGLSKDKLEHIRSNSRGNDTKAAADVVSAWAEKEQDGATVKQLANVVDRYDSKLANCIRDLQTADANTLAKAFTPRHIYDLFGEQDIFAVSIRLKDNYKEVANELGLSTEVVGIISDASRETDILGARGMLKLWRKVDKGMCTWSRLIEAARKVNEETAEALDKIRKEGPLDDCVLEELALHLGIEWQAVGIRLRFSTRQIFAIVADSPTEEIAIVNMLRIFRTKILPSDNDTHHAVLCAALRDTERKDLAIVLAGK